MKTVEPRLTNPFPGLRPFRSDEHHLFFGREEQTAALLQLLRTNRFLAVVGTSGSGKSSLVRAGMIAELYGGTMTRAGSSWEVMILRPGGSPIENLARAFVEADLYDPEDPSTLPRLLATLNRSRFGLVEAMKQSEVFEPGTNLLVVVDQFEELFRFRQQGVDSEETAAAFVNLMLTASGQPECPIYVTITMRSDYLGDCSEIPGLAEAVNDGEYLIPRLLRDQKRDAIEKPIGVGGARISPMLVQRLLNDVGDDPDQLPVLQHALMRMWDAWSAGSDHDRPIDFADFEATGGLAAALSNHADEIYDALPDDRHRSTCEKIFKTLTEKGEDNRGIRRPTRLARLQAIADSDRDTVTTVLDAFRGHGVTLLMPGTEVRLDDRTVIDLSHESLMRGWQRLRMWVEDEAQSARIFRRLLDTARLWSDGKAGLFRDPDLQIALSWREQEAPNAEWAEQYGGHFETAIGFLETSSAEAEAERRAREAARERELEQARQLAEAQQLRLEQQLRAARRLRMMIAGLAAVAAIAGVACVAALLANQRAITLAAAARQNEEKARQNEESARQSARRAEESRQETAKALAVVASQKAQVEGSLSKAEAAERLARTEEEKARAAEEAGRKLLYTTDMRLAPFVWRDDRTTAEQLRVLLAKHVPGSKTVVDKELVPVPAKSDLRGFEWRYYQHLLRASATVFSGHGVSVIDGAFTANGPLVTLDQNGQLRRWDLSSEAEDQATRRDLSGGPGAQMRVLSPDGRFAALAEGTKVHVFDTSTGDETFQIDSANVSSRKVIFSRDNDRLVVVDDKIRWLSAASGETIASIDRKFDRVESLALSADGLTMAVVGHAQTGHLVSIFRLDATAKAVTPLAKDLGVAGTLYASALTPDGGRIAVGAKLAGALLVLDTATGRSIAQHGSAHASPIAAMAFSADGTRLATADAEGTIKIWADPQKLNSKSTASSTLKGHQGAIHGVGFSIDGKRLVTTSADKTARVWDLENAGAAIRPLERSGLSFVVRVSPDGQLIASAGGSRLRLWDAATGQPVRELPALEKVRISSVAFSPTDHRVMAVGYGGEADVSHVVLWDIDSGIELARLAGATDLPDFQVTRDSGPVGALAFSPDGKYLVAGFGSKNMLMSGRFPTPLKVWEVATRRLIRRLNGHANYCVSLDFSRDGTLLASGSRDGTAILWSTATWKATRTLPNPDKDSIFGRTGLRGMVEDVAFSPDGKTLAMASREANVHLWDVATGQVLETLKGHSSAVVALAFSPDGRTLASGGTDQTVRLWNGETRRELMQLDPGGVELGQVQTLAFSPDGRQLLAGAKQAAFWSTTPIVWGDPDRAAEKLRLLLKSNADFPSRIRMLSENLRLYEALARLDAKDARVQAALAAAQANWHASRKAWPEAVAALDRQVAVDPSGPDAWLRTPGLLRLATALLHQDRPGAAARMLQGGAKRRAQDGLPDVVDRVGIGVAYAADDETARVTELLPAFPGSRPGLVPGDTIVRVNDTELTRETMPRLGELLAGEAGTKVRLTVQRPGSDRPREIELTRARSIHDAATGAQLYPLSAALDERLAREPRNPALLELRAELAGQWSGAESQVADYTAAIEAMARQKSDVASGDLKRLYARRGNAHLAARQWQHAVDDYARALTGPDTDEDLLANQATALAEVMLGSEKWTVLRPTEMKSSGGATLTRLDDDSILAGGKLAAPDIYTVTVRTDRRKIRAVRLETLVHPSLPGLGPGRSNHGPGNFVLSELTLSERRPGDHGEGSRLPIRRAEASWFQETYETQKLIDGNLSPDHGSGWAIGPRWGRSHEVCLYLADEVVLDSGSELIVRLFNNYNSGDHNVGRFRLSVSGDPPDLDREQKRFAILELDLDDPWQKLAAAYRLRGDHQAIDQLVERRPKLAGPIGDLFTQGKDEEKDWRRAIALYSKGITETTTDVDLLSKRARAHEALRNWDAAAADWSRAATGSQNGAGLLADFARRLAADGQALLANGQFEKAQALYEKERQADPGNDVVAAELARLLLDKVELSASSWVVLKPADTKTRNGSKLTLENDGSILVEAPEETIRWEPSPRPVQALRIETGTRAIAPTDGAPSFNEYQVVAAGNAAPGSGAIRGQFVRLDLPGESRRFPRHPDEGDRKTINLAELQVFRGDQNIALRKKARQSSNYNSLLAAECAVDGNTVGNDEGNPYAHTATENNPWWEVDLGNEQVVDRMVVWNRSDANLYSRMNHFRIRVLDHSRKVVFERVIDRAPNPSREIVRPRFLAEANGALTGGNQPWVLRLPVNSHEGGPFRFRVSVATSLVDLSQEKGQEEPTRPEWAALRPAGSKTESGSKLTLEGDGSIRVDRIEETVRWQPSPTPVQAMRIETSTRAIAPTDGAPSFNEYQVVAASVATSGSGAIRGRFVRLDLPGDSSRFPRLASDLDKKAINLAELQVFQGDQNIALRKKARLSSNLGNEQVAELAVDGNTAGDQPHIAHSGFEQMPWWEVDLGSEQAIDRMVVWNRTDWSLYKRMSHFRVRVLDRSRKLVFEQVVEQAPIPSTEIVPRALLAEAKPAPIGESGPLILRLPRNSNSDAPARFRVSVAARLPDVDLDQNRQEAMKIDDIATRLAVAYEMSGRKEEALAHFRTALEQADGYEARKPIVELAARYDEVLSALMKERPDDPQVRLASARKLAERGKQLLAEKQPARAQVELEKSIAILTPLRGEPRWSVLTPTEMTSEIGARMDLQKDGSIFVHQGEPARNDTYTLLFPSRMRGIKGLRLEALADSRLPRGGPGWKAGYGNFVLTELTFQAAPAGSPDQPRPIALRNASADFSEKYLGVGNAIDGNDGTGWAINPELNKDHTAVFELAEPVDDGQASPLTIRLHHQWHDPGFNLGRFRVSFTDDAAAIRATRIRQDFKDGEVAGVIVALAKAHAQQGQTKEAVASFAEALRLAEDRAAKARIIAEAAPLEGVLERLAERASGDGSFLAELARHLAERGSTPLADAARARARAWFEAKLAKEPENSTWAGELVDLLLEAFEHEGRNAARWSILKPTAMKSAGGATLTLQPDGSILASGTNPDRDDYTLVARPDLEQITAIRLEALPDPSLPHNGPGRASHNGNFNLNELQVFSGGRPCTLTNINVVHDEMQEFRNIIDGRIDAIRGWSTHPMAGKPNTAIVATRLQRSPAEDLRFELHFSRHPEWTQHGLGRFRLSVSGDPAVFDQEAKRFAAMGIADPWAKLAAAYHLIGDQPALESLIRRRPDAASGIGDLYAANQDWKRALAEYDKAITPRCKDARIFAARADAHEKLEHWELAAADWGDADLHASDKTVRYGNPSLPALERRAEIHRRLQQYDKMVADCDELLKPARLGKNPWIFVKRGEAYDQLRQWQRARPDYDRAIKLSSSAEQGTFYFYRAIHFAAQGQWKRAADDLHKAYQKPTDFVGGPFPCTEWWALRDAALIYAIAGYVEDYDRAVSAWYRKQSARTPDADESKWTVLTTLLFPEMITSANRPRLLELAGKTDAYWRPRLTAAIQYRSGDFQKAAEFFDANDPGPSFLFLSALTDHKLGKPGRAKQRLDEGNAWVREQREKDRGAGVPRPIHWLEWAHVVALQFEASEAIVGPGVSPNTMPERAVGEAQFQAALARHYAGRGNPSLADAARAKARGLFQERLAREPENSVLAAELAGLLLDQQENEDAARWTVIKPMAMKSAGGATLTLQDDGSIVASDKNPDRDSYTITARIALDRIRAIRIEALPHVSLPLGGPGRYPTSGNFTLHEFRAFSGTKPTALSPLFATYDQVGGFHHIADGKIDENAWDLYPQSGRKHTAFLGADFSHEMSDELKFEMDFSRGKWSGDNLGHFRLSVTADPATLAREEKRVAAMKLTDPWAKLAAAYVLTGETERAADMLAKSGEKGWVAPWLECGLSIDAVLDSLQARHPERSANLLPGYASAAAERGQPDRARTLYARLVKLQPKNGLWKERSEQLGPGVIAVWNFDHGPGRWGDARDCEFLIKDGALTVRTTGGDPFFSTSVSAPPGGMALVLRYRTDKAFPMQVFWADASGGFDESRHLDYQLPASAGEWRETAIPFWPLETLKALRLDPNTVAEHPLEIDSIRLRRLGPSEAGMIIPDPIPLAHLAVAYQSAGRTREALPLLVMASAANPKDTMLSLKVAALQAWFGQDQGLADTCGRALEFAKGTSDPATAERASKICSLRPTVDKTRLESSLALARKAVEIGKTDGLLPWFQLALGMGEYRSGHFAEADAPLIAAAEGAKNNPAVAGPAELLVAGTSAFYRAMSLFQRGKKDEARKLATAAAAKMKPLPADEQNPLAGGADHDDLIRWLAYKEAKAMIHFDVAPAAPESTGRK